MKYRLAKLPVFIECCYGISVRSLILLVLLAAAADVASARQDGRAVPSPSDSKQDAAIPKISFSDLKALTLKPTVTNDDVAGRRRRRTLYWTPAVD